MTNTTATAVLHTTQGDIRVNLFGLHAPKTVRNFIGLATGTQSWRDPRTGERQHAGERRIVERRRLGGRLDLDDTAGAGQHEIGVGLGRRVLGVVKIEHRHTFDHAARHRRDAVIEGQRGQ